jgi:hypothetical protein
MYSVGLDELLLFLFFFSKHGYIAKRSGIATFTSEGTTESIDRTKEILFGSILGDGKLELPPRGIKARINTSVFYPKFKGLILALATQRARFSSGPTYSNKNSENRSVERLNPFLVTGFSDAESCFFLSLFKDNGRKTG